MTNEELEILHLKAKCFDVAQEIQRLTYIHNTLLNTITQRTNNDRPIPESTESIEPEKQSADSCS